MSARKIAFSLSFLLLVSAGTLGEAPPSSSNYIFYSQRGRRVVPLILVHLQSYLPLIELLEWVDLPYSESASAGFVQISVGTNVLRLNRDRNTVLVNESTVALPSPTLYFEGRWLVSPDFVVRVLNRVLPEKIAVSGSGNRFCLGGVRFNRINARGGGSEQGSRIVVHMTSPAEAEIRKEQNKMIFSFGVTPVDPAREDFQYRDSLINGVAFEETPTSGQLVVYLADKALQTRVTHIPDQGVYLLEVGPVGTDSRSGEGGGIESSSGMGPPFITGRQRHQVVIDPGHGGKDRGTQIKEGLLEKDVSLAVARKLRWILLSRLGINAVLSRNEDQTLSLEERAVAANITRSDLFISIHIGNWSHARESRSYAYVAKFESPDPSAEGGQAAVVQETSRIQFLPWDSSQWLSLNRSVQLAGLVQTELNRSVNGGDSSLNFRRAPLKVLLTLAMPAVLVEIGNAKEPAFQQSIAGDQFQNTVAFSLLAAIEKYYNATQGH